NRLERRARAAHRRAARGHRTRGWHGTRLPQRRRPDAHSACPAGGGDRSMTDLAKVAETALRIALEASDVVNRVYATPFEVEFKGKDDPVTRADREANELACERLARAFPGVAIVAEESDPRSYAGFARHDRVWFVDPLDGTREFVARNGEFAVMLGLAEGGRALVGVIVAPAWGRAFVGIVGEGAWEVSSDGSRRP